jgi:hypothetical protein
MKQKDTVDFYSCFALFKFKVRIFRFLQKHQYSIPYNARLRTPWHSQLRLEFFSSDDYVIDFRCQHHLLLLVS